MTQRSRSRSGGAKRCIVRQSRQRTVQRSFAGLRSAQQSRRGEAQLFLAMPRHDRAEHSEAGTAMQIEVERSQVRRRPASLSEAGKAQLSAAVRSTAQQSLCSTAGEAWRIEAKLRLAVSCLDQQSRRCIAKQSSAPSSKVELVAVQHGRRCVARRSVDKRSRVKCSKAGSALHNVAKFSAAECSKAGEAKFSEVRHGVTQRCLARSLSSVVQQSRLSVVEHCIAMQSVGWRSTAGQAKTGRAEHRAVEHSLSLWSRAKQSRRSNAQLQKAEHSDVEHRPAKSSKAGEAKPCRARRRLAHLRVVKQSTAGGAVRDRARLSPAPFSPDEHSKAGREIF